LRLLLLLLALPIVELFLLIRLSEVTGWRFTIAFTIVTGIVGAAVASRQRLWAVRRVVNELESGQLPAAAILDVVMIFVAGLLLIVPGILTDIIGATFLIPPCRRLYRKLLIRWVEKRFRGRITAAKFGSGLATRQPSPDSIVDSYVIDRSDEPKADK
jgi:UPF0716 protein FxsA